MFGVNHSVKKLLENDIPKLFVIKCVCHSLALCASYATGKIPDYVENMVRDIYNYMKYSFKRQNEFNQFQVFTDTKPHKLLKMSQTRWLSLHCCIKRILEQLKALQSYFKSEQQLDSKARGIYLGIMDPTFEHYLYFLDFALPILTNLNQQFQSEKPQIHNLYSKMASSYKMILDCYMKSDYLKSTDIQKIQYRNPIYFNEDIYVGGKCVAILSSDKCSLTQLEKRVFYTTCLNFYVECSHQIFQRFPFHSPHMMFLKQLSFLNPSEIKNINALGQVVSFYEQKLNIDLNDIDREWRSLKTMDLNFDLDVTEF